MLEALTTEPVSSDDKLKSKTLDSIDPREFYPRLAAQINLYSDRLVLSQHGQEFTFPASQFSGKVLNSLFSQMNGAHSLHELQNLFSPKESEIIAALINNLDKQGLVDNAAPIAIHPGQDTLLELEAVARQLIASKLFDHSETGNYAWLQLLQLPVSEFSSSELTEKIIYGFAIEHWCLFSQISYFQSPILGFQNGAKVRHLLNELYKQTDGYERLMVKALGKTGITSEDLKDVLPLPQTVSITNGLAFWSNFEPLFFLSILGILLTTLCNGLTVCLAEAENRRLDISFTEPIRQLVNTHKEAAEIVQHVFQEIPHIDLETNHRFKRQVHLFSEMICHFYRAIGLHYIDIPDLLRKIEAV